MIAIMAKRPFAIPAANFGCLSAASLGVGTFQPWSPAVSAVPAGWSWDSSQKAQPATLYERPAAGTSEMAPSLFEKPANSSLAGGAGYLGSLPVRSGVMQPMIADVGNVIKPN